MKRLLLAFSILLCAGSSSLLLAQKGGTTTPKASGPIITWDHDEHNFGKIVKGQAAVHRFTFINTGTTALVLKDVHASCGCTTPQWSKEPIPPGAQGYVEASFNSNAIVGSFNKTITITSNVPDRTEILFIKGEVESFGDRPSMETGTENPPIRIGY